MKIITAALLSVLSLSAFVAQSQTTLTLQRVIELPGGTKFDHFAIDLKANHLFIASTGNQSVEALDLKSGTIANRLTGFGKPHGLAWLPATNRLYASDGAKADLKIFAGRRLLR